jgi:hypothetical protein
MSRFAYNCCAKGRSETCTIYRVGRQGEVILTVDRDLTRKKAKTVTQRLNKAKRSR